MNNRVAILAPACTLPAYAPAGCDLAQRRACEGR